MSTDATRKTGRPTKYDPHLHPSLAEAWAAAGKIEEEIAEKLGISRATLKTWKREHPAFLAAVKAGKEPSNDRVKRSLFERAVGYSHPSEEIFCAFGKVTRAKTIKHYPPDTTAAIFWLCNRDRENWKHVAHLLHSGELKTSPVVFVSGLPEGLAPAPAAAAEPPGVAP